MPAAINKTEQSTLRNRLSVNGRLRVSIVAADVWPTLYPTEADCQFGRSATDRSHAARRRYYAAIARLAGRHEMMIEARDKKLEAARENRKLKRPTTTRLCSLIPKANRVIHAEPKQ